jgi:hypothetical protein
MLLFDRNARNDYISRVPNSSQHPRVECAGRIRGRFARGHASFRNGGRRGKTAVLKALALLPDSAAKAAYLASVATDENARIVDRLAAVQIMCDALDGPVRRIRYRI